MIRASYATKVSGVFGIIGLLLEIDIRSEKISLKVFFCLLPIERCLIILIFVFFEFFSKLYLIWPTVFVLPSWFFLDKLLNQDLVCNFQSAIDLSMLLSEPLLQL